jgi:hypothetical protein
MHHSMASKSLINASVFTKKRKMVKEAQFLIIFLLASPILVSSVPEKRIGSRMIYDPVDNRIILYGGAHWQGRYIFYGELWSYEYENNTWSILDSYNAPDPRFNHMLAYLPSRHQLFLFGGWSEEDRIADTWIFDFESSSWTELHPRTHPSPRSDSSIAYDPQNDVIVLFSGYLLNDTHSQDTWIYSFEEENWIEKKTDNPPLGQYGHYMIYAESTGQLLMYPGHWNIYSDGELQSHGYGGNLWEYDVFNNTWITHYSSYYPPGRYWGNMVYDSTEDRIIFFGGHGTVNYDDTWIYKITEREWEKIEQVDKPSKRSSFSLCYDPENHVVVLFGGFSDDRQSLGDIWILDCETLTWYQPEANKPEKSNSEEVNENIPIPGFPLWTASLGIIIFYLIRLQRDSKACAHLI